MSFVEMNNEVVLMRRFVRQARTCIVNKLVREAKTLRSKRGDEKQQQKYSRKADRLIKEVLAIKKMKDDDVILFGIDNTTDLNDILKDTSATEDTRILGRVTNHKSLKPLLQKFKQKFPDHKAYVESRRKRHNKPQKKSTRKKQEKVKKEAVLKDNSGFEESEVDNSDVNLNEEEALSNEVNNDSPQCISALNTTKKPKCDTLVKNKKTHSHSSDSDDILTVESDVLVKPVSKETTVKRFTEFLQTQETEASHQREEEQENVTLETQMSTADNGMEKENDAFFLTADDTHYYANSSNVNSKNVDLQNKYDSPVRNYMTSKLQERNSKREFFKGKGGKYNKKHNTLGPKIDLKRFGNRDETFPERQSKKNDFSKDLSQKTRVERRKAIANENEKLHPSWEAKKKQREIMSSGFQGKKIVFDDD